MQISMIVRHQIMLAYSTTRSLGGSWLAMVARGEIMDAKTVMLLQWAALNR